MKRKSGLFLMILGAVLLIAALSLLVYNFADNKRAGKEAEEVVSELNSLISEREEERDREIAKYSYSLFQEDEPCVEFNGKYYIGILSIPSLELKLPVMKDWSYPNLKTAPCCYSGSVSENNLVIAAHNYNTHFGRLKYIREGDEVTFTDIDGNIFKYEVEFSETIVPTAIEYMTAGDYPLTLFTCNYSGQARIAVRCIRSRKE